MSKAKRTSGDASLDSDPDPDSGLHSGDGSLSFEGALDQLEQTVARLEAGEMPLEEALELFEAGVNLSRQCDATLEAAERRVEILIADRADNSADDSVGEEASEDFDFEDDSEDFED
jgi:exodeoxyribonuclease VII small subunit